MIIGRQISEVGEEPVGSTQHTRPIIYLYVVAAVAAAPLAAHCTVQVRLEDLATSPTHKKYCNNAVYPSSSAAKLL